MRHAEAHARTRGQAVLHHRDDVLVVGVHDRSGQIYVVAVGRVNSDGAGVGIDRAGCEVVLGKDCTLRGGDDAGEVDAAAVFSCRHVVIAEGDIARHVERAVVRAIVGDEEAAARGAGRIVADGTRGEIDRSLMDIDGAAAGGGLVAVGMAAAQGAHIDVTGAAFHIEHATVDGRVFGEGGSGGTA